MRPFIWMWWRLAWAAGPGGGRICFGPDVWLPVYGSLWWRSRRHAAPGGET